MWLAIREDLGMSSGKAMIQSGHAFQWHAVDQTIAGNNLFAEYMADRLTPKVCVRVKDEATLHKIIAVASEALLSPVLVVDEGRTEFDGRKTPTCVVFGPAYRDELPPLLKRLQLWKDPEASA